MKLTCGTKQVLKAIENGSAVKVYIARDAELFISDKIKKSAIEHGVETEFADTMAELGKKCGIAVGAAAAAEIRH